MKYKYILGSLGYLVLLAAVMLGWSAIIPKSAPKPPTYNYIYDIPEDSLSIGRILVVQSIDTTSGDEEYPDVIEVRMTTHR